MELNGASKRPAKKKSLILRWILYSFLTTLCLVIVLCFNFYYCYQTSIYSKGYKEFRGRVVSGIKDYYKNITALEHNRRTRYSSPYRAFLVKHKFGLNIAPSVDFTKIKYDDLSLENETIFTKGSNNIIILESKEKKCKKKSVFDYFCGCLNDYISEDDHIESCSAEYPRAPTATSNNNSFKILLEVKEGEVKYGITKYEIVNAKAIDTSNVNETIEYHYDLDNNAFNDIAMSADESENRVSIDKNKITFILSEEFREDNASKYIKVEITPHPEELIAHSIDDRFEYYQRSNGYLVCNE